MIYILLQLVCAILYSIALIDEKVDEIRPSLFIVLVATFLLVFVYSKKKETVANTVYN
jgi:NADH:ubiquinone oxidoreductase subunit 3 (subunit A)